MPRLLTASVLASLLGLVARAQVQNYTDYPLLVSSLNVLGSKPTSSDIVFGELIDGRVCFFKASTVLDPYVCTDCGRVNIYTSNNMTSAFTFTDVGECLAPNATSTSPDCEGNSNTNKRTNACGVCDSASSPTNPCSLDFITNSVPTIAIAAVTAAGTYYTPRVFNPSDFNNFKVDIVNANSNPIKSLAGSGNVYYRVQSIQSDTVASSKNAFSIIASSTTFEATFSINTTQVVKAYAQIKTGAPLTLVATAFFKSDPNVSTIPPDIPIAIVVGASVGGAVLIGGIIGLVFYIRIKRRKAQMETNLDLAEKSAKQNQYRAVFDYKPQNPDELELKVGDIVQITKKNPDGWWEGVSYRLKRKKGMFPSNYVEEVTSERLMWVERPQTMFGRMSQRLSMAFGLGGSTPATPAMPPKNASSSTQNLIPPQPAQRGGPPQNGYGAAPPQQGYGGAPPQQGYGGAPPSRPPPPQNYGGGAPPSRPPPPQNYGGGQGGYGAAPPNRGYGAPGPQYNNGGNYI